MHFASIPSAFVKAQLPSGGTLIYGVRSDAGDRGNSEELICLCMGGSFP